MLYKVRVLGKLNDFEEFLLASGKSPETVRQYIGKVQQLLRFVRRDTITRDDVIRFLAYVRKTFSLYTYNLVYYALRSFFQYIKRMDLLEGIPAPKKPQRLPRYLTVEEVRKLIEKTGYPRDRAIILLLFTTGLRVSELVSLKIGDVNFQQGIIRVYRHKTQLESEIPVADIALFALREAINTYIRTGPDAPLFQNKYGEALSVRSVQRIVREAAKRAGIKKKVTPHCLRHTFATFALSKGLNVVEIQELLGITSLKTVRVYTHIVKTELEKKYHNIFSVSKPKEEKPRRELKIMFCPNCGMKVLPTWKYCVNCGTDLTKTT